jgi:hypothetical protein
MAKIKYYNSNTGTWEYAEAINPIITDAECETLSNLLNTTPDIENEYKSMLEELMERQLSLESAQAEITTNVSDLYYIPGDVLDFRLWTAGMLTGDRKLVRFVLPISKPCKNISNILCTNIECKVRQEDKYVFGSASAYGVPEALSFNASENHISVEITIP